MSANEIIYEFIFEDERRRRFELAFDEKTFELAPEPVADPPEWIELGFHQCPNCTLDPGETPFCPQAESLLPIIRSFDDAASYDPVRLRVVMDGRTVTQDTNTARGVSSLMGLLIATCGCPVTRFFIPMGRFHLPLATPDETLFRASASYLLGQYFLSKRGRRGELSLEGLLKVYDEMQIVNLSMLERLRAATKTDSTVNALILLDIFAKFALFDIDESLENIRHLFEPFLNGLRDRKYMIG